MAQPQATVIGFDDLNGSYNVVPNSYEGLVWNNADFAIADNFDFTYGESGFDHGLVSPSHVSFNHVDTKPYVAIDKLGTFDLNSAYLTSAMYVGEKVTVKGLLHGTLVYKQTVVVSDDHAAQFVFNFKDIDKLTIIGKGGAHDPNVTGDTHQVVLDDLSLTFYGFGAAPLGNHGGSAVAAGSMDAAHPDAGLLHPHLAIA